MCRKLLVFVLVLAFAGAVQAADPIFSDGFETGDFSGWTGWHQGPNDPVPVQIGPLTTPTTVWWAGGTVVEGGYAGSSYAADFYAGAWWSTGGGAYNGVLGDFGGVPVSISAYANVLTHDANYAVPGGIDMVFYDGVPDETVDNPPSLGRVDLNIFNFGAADPDGWRYGLLTAVAPAMTTYMKFEINCMTVGGEESGEVLFDNVVGTPEPATIALLGLGGLALIRRKR